MVIISDPVIKQPGIFGRRLEGGFWDTKMGDICSGASHVGSEKNPHTKK